MSYLYALGLWFVLGLLVIGLLRVIAEIKKDVAWNGRPWNLPAVMAYPLYLLAYAVLWPMFLWEVWSDDSED